MRLSFEEPQREIMVFLHSRRRRRDAGGADLQDLRRRRRAGHVGESLSAGERHSRHRLQDRRRDRNDRRYG
jgi:hypothetical protein